MAKELHVSLISKSGFIKKEKKKKAPSINWEEYTVTGKFPLSKIPQTLKCFKVNDNLSAHCTGTGMHFELRIIIYMNCLKKNPRKLQFCSRQTYHNIPIVHFLCSSLKMNFCLKEVVLMFPAALPWGDVSIKITSSEQKCLSNYEEVLLMFLPCHAGKWASKSLLQNKNVLSKYKEIILMFPAALPWEGVGAPKSLLLNRNACLREQKIQGKCAEGIKSMWIALS